MNGGKKNPQMGQEAETKCDPTKTPKSGVAQPWKAAHNNTSSQLRPKKSHQNIITTPIPICTSTPLVKKQLGRTFFVRACGCAGRSPCSISELCNTGLPPSVLGKETLTHTNLPSKKGEISFSPIRLSRKSFKDLALLSTLQVTNNQHGGDVCLTPLSLSDYMTALLSPDQLRLSALDFFSDAVFSSENSLSESLSVSFSKSDVLRLMSPSYLSNHGKSTVDYPHPKWTLQNTYTVIDYSSEEDSQQGKVLSVFHQEEELLLSSIYSSIGSSNASVEYPHPKWTLHNTYTVIDSSEEDSQQGKVLSVFHQEEELLLSSTTHSSIGSSNASALSPEALDDSRKYNPCIFL